MSDGVKRDYRSDLRAAHALQTRRAVVAAAAELFVAQGYGTTTIDSVAAAAGVSRKTVFTAVGGKLDLLKTALDWAVAGDDRPAALADRDVMRRLLALDDPAEMISRWVHQLVEIDARVGPLVRALEIAADSEAGARTLLEQSERQRLAGARTIVRRLTELQALAPTHNEAVDIAWLATDALLYDRLVRIRGWSQRRFEKWLADSLTMQLIS